MDWNINKPSKHKKKQIESEEDKNNRFLEELLSIIGPSRNLSLIEREFLLWQLNELMPQKYLVNTDENKPNSSSLRLNIKEKIRKIQDILLNY